MIAITETTKLLDKIYDYIGLGELPHSGITIDGVNYSSYMGYLCLWNGTTPCVVCRMDYFYNYMKVRSNG